jgi:hypothetical protein
MLPAGHRPSSASITCELENCAAGIATVAAAMGIATVAAEVFSKAEEAPHEEQNLPLSAICEEHFGQVSIVLSQYA